MKALESTHVFNHPYSIGVLLVVNAVPDAFLLLDAPECAQWRPGFIQGSHDALSSLWDMTGAHRVQISCTTTDRLASGNQEDIASRLRRMAAAPGCGALLAVGYPMARIAGTSYETIWRSLKPAPDVAFFPVAGGSVSDDWLDGYAHTLLALAKRLVLPPLQRRAEDVAIVGYMHDRGERDHAGNIAELRRMLSGIGLNLVSVWPGAVGAAELEAAASAGTVLSFPYGREAAAVLAGRLGAGLVVCGLPLGLNACAEWLIQVGAAVGRRDSAKAFAERELGRLSPRLAWAVERLFVHARFVFAGDPVLVRPLARQLSELGGRMTAALVAGGAHHARLFGSWNDLAFPVYEAPSNAAGRRIMRGLFEGEDPADCLIGCVLEATDLPRHMRPVELGFPSYHSHAWHDRPFLGFEGAVCLLSRLTEELLWRPEAAIR